MSTVRQITIRNPSKGLYEQIRFLSQARGESINSTILYLLEKAIGINRRRERLRRYVVWSEQERKEFEKAHRAHRTIEPDLWK